jgi:Type II restriction endonuclease EcoO109I
MKYLNLNQIAEYVAANVGTFHKKRLESLENLKLKEILQRKNPYLFKAKNILTAQDLVKSILDAFLQSQEETMFGDFIEGVAIFVCKQINDAKKSMDLVGIDLEFERDDNYYVIEIKSGPNWGNSSQIKKLLDNFAAAREKLKDKNVVAINGCCYGRDNKPHKDEYIKLCGQRF